MTLFYHFGFGLFRHLGEFPSILFGVGFFALQCAVSRRWLANFHYGPLEWVWRCLTFLSFKTPFRKSRPAAEAPIAAVAVEVVGGKR
ncbi:MAG TPA: DUF418 domain-containing protein, partial [Opitutaceae bacterium]|nr:DUF418 domain-containing protein [Opitutaceae bacterium]